MLLAAPFPVQEASVNDEEEIPAVNMKVHLEGGHLELELTATTVKFPQLQPDDLDVDHDVLQQFLKEKDAILGSDKLGLKVVQVLPNMTSVRLVSVSKQLPQDCIFSDWRHLEFLKV